MKQWCLLIPFLAVCLCGCNAPFQPFDLTREVAREEVFGVWVLTPRAGEMIAQNQATGTKPEKCFVRFSADGSCEFDSAYSLSSELRYLKSSGTWALEHDTNGGWVNHTVKNVLRLKMDSRDFASNTYLYFREENGKLILWDFHGDPDSMQMIEYIKEDSPGTNRTSPSDESP